MGGTWTGPVVAGIDGAPGSVSTVAVAAEQARLRGVDLVVVTAWEPVQHPGYAGAPRSGGDTSDDAQRRLDDIIAAAQQDVRGLTVRTEVRQGHPEQVLRAAAAGASVLVVGAHSRGGGGGAAVGIGTVARACAGFGDCPVLIVPPPTR